MFLKSLSLTNIRSYEEQTIAFPKGSILLSGDVGSGKTTILLAIEFALFGILRGELNAKSLLRHGCINGSVTLEFQIQEVTYKIQRTLKREATSIKQGPGIFWQNDVKESLTAVELKSKILEVLGYPQDVLTKAKSLIFRYTVYTPQEQMRKILFESAESRLETLRKIFGIDQYKIMKDNTAFVSKELRAEYKALQVQLEELPVYEKNLQVKKDELAITSEQEEKLAAEKKELESSLEKLKTYVLKKEKEALIIQKKKSDIQLLEKEITSTKEKILLMQNQLKSLNNYQKTEISFDKNQLITLNKKILVYEQSMQKINEKITLAREKKVIYETKIKQHQKTNTEELLAGSTCPVCKQIVDENHSKKMKEEITSKIEDLRKKAETVTSFLEKALEKKSLAEKKLVEIKKERDSLRAKEIAIKQEEKKLLQMKEQIKKLQQNINSLQKVLPEKNKEKDTLQSSLSTTKKFDIEFSKLKTDLEQAKNTLNQKSITLTRIQENTKHIQKEIQLTQQQISKLKTIQDRCAQNNLLMHWLQEAALPIISRIEQEVFSSLHKEFKLLLSDWFETLIDDQNTSVALEKDFSPTIFQGRYENDVYSLSGGEKTAVALAYRLALNQIINEFIGNILTRDILILDEPTDGFSQNQLQKLRIILGKLKLSQLIIVSHEESMASFVDHVFKVHKYEGQSTISTHNVA